MTDINSISTFGYFDKENQYVFVFGWNLIDEITNEKTIAYSKIQLKEQKMSFIKPRIELMSKQVFL